MHKSAGIRQAVLLVLTQKISYNYPMQKYKVLNHTADIGCEIFGKTRKDLFANSIAALFDLILEHNHDRGKNFAPASKVTPEEKKIIIAGNDLEDLMINFLREILFFFNGKHWVTTGCHIVELTGKRIIAQLSGEPYNPRKHQIKMEIKAVTYHKLRIKRIDKGWKARVIFDV